jgi:hypothetical protein
MESGKGAVDLFKINLTFPVLRAETGMCITYVTLLNMIRFVNLFVLFVLSRGFKARVRILK